MTTAIRWTPGLQAPARMALVAGAHVLALWVIAGALNVHIPGISAPPLVLVPNVDAPTPPKDTPAVVPNGVGVIEKVTPDVPVPTIKLDGEQIDVTDPGPLDPGPGVATTEPQPDVLIAVRADPSRPLTQPAYPAPSVRGGEEGTVELELRVAATGQVLDARVYRTSGFPRLDAAAVAEALRHWHLLPATRNGEPIEAWRRQRVVFRLDNR